ncbi:unnamed protein product, partial [Adineta ricciae]
VVKEKEQAKQEYREAIAKGHGAYLMHQEEAQVFSVAVGNLPANTEVIIKITYVAELEIENGDIMFRLPAKMTSWQSKQAIEARDQSILRSIGMIDEKVEFTFRASIRMPYNITKLFSPTHRLRRKITNCIAMVELVDNILLDRDFILSITLNSPNLPRISIETLEDSSSQACMLTFYPKFEAPAHSREEIEIIFIVDVSNSMDGTHVHQAKQLAHLFLTNLSINDVKTYFNIITFGSDNDECFPMSVPTTKENLDKAKHFVLHSLIHRGNTDLFSVLHRYSLLPSKFSRQFILLSDGHIHDLQSILILLKHQSTFCRDRLFTCSVGNVANKHCLKQLANEASGGGLTIIFDSNYRSKWKAKVLNLLEHVRQPCVTSVSINWDGHIDEQERFHMQAPKTIRSLFNGMRITVYRFVQNCHKATLTAMVDGQEFVTTVFSNPMTMTRGRILHCLTARAIIDDYANGLLDADESENELIKVQYKRDLIDLSIKHSVVSAYTSFVAIEERDTKSNVENHQPGVRLLDIMLESDTDLLPYMGWDGDVSNASLMKQKLIDACTLLDSTPIQRKKEVIVDIEKLCESISYRASGDAKCEIMMNIIRTCRHSLKEYAKADEIEQKMRRDILMEMVGATAEERQVLEQQCQANNLIFTDDEMALLSSYDEISDPFEANFKKLTPIDQTKKMRELTTTLEEKIDLDNGCFLPTISTGENIPPSLVVEEQNLPTVEQDPWENILQELATKDDWSTTDFGFLDCLDETSYVEITSRLDEVRSRRMRMFQDAEIEEKDGDVDVSSLVNLPLGGEDLPADLNLRLESNVGYVPTPNNEKAMEENDEMDTRASSVTLLSKPEHGTATSRAATPVASTIESDTLYRRISLVDATALNASRHRSGCMSSSAPSESKIKTRVPDQPLSGRHGGPSRVMNEPASLHTRADDKAVSERSQFVLINQDEQRRETRSPIKHMSTEELKLQSEQVELSRLVSNARLKKENRKQEMRGEKNVVEDIIDISAFYQNPMPMCDLLLLDVCPLGLGIGDIHGQMHTLIRRNTTIPTRTQFWPIFTNAYAYQATATIRIFEGEHKLTKYNEFLGEFDLSGLTSNLTSRTLQISVRMDIDANGILRVDAEEELSGAKATYTVHSSEKRLSSDDIQRHLIFVEGQTNAAAKSAYDRTLDDPLCQLGGQVQVMQHNFSGEFANTDPLGWLSPVSICQYICESIDQTTDISLLRKLKDVCSTSTIINELMKLQFEDGSFTLNKQLADVFHLDCAVFQSLEHYLAEHGFKSLALNLQNEILRLIGTGVILLWLVHQSQASHSDSLGFSFSIEQIKIHLCMDYPSDIHGQILKAIEFYQRVSQQHGIYCKQLELEGSSWNMFVQYLFFADGCHKTNSI